MHSPFFWQRWLLCCCLLCGQAFATRAHAQEPTSKAESTIDRLAEEKRQTELDSQIAQLIEQLGAKEFAIREQAKNQLQRIGLLAFDALIAAQYHRDVEIDMQVRYLIDSAPVPWVLDTDPPEVKPVLKSYGLQPYKERQTRIDKLALLEQSKAAPALCRIVRYEREEILSKAAALAIIKQPALSENESAAAAERVQLGVGNSKRRAAQWLRYYTRWLQEPETALPEGTRLLNEEFAQLTGVETQTSTEIVTQLGRWHAETLYRMDHRDDATAIVKRLASLLDGSKEKILEHIGWLAQREMWSYLLDTYERYRDMFNDDATLLYRVAEAQRKLGDSAADATAASALALGNATPELRIPIGFGLAERGLFDWAEAEYRAAIEKVDATSINGLRTRFLLSEMLHDQQRELEAAQALEPIVTAIQQQAVKDLIDRLGRDPGGIESRMHYFFALDLIKKGEQAAALVHLEKGAKADPNDADVLIAIYRLPNSSSEQRSATKELIRKATVKFQEDVLEHSRDLSQSQAQAQNEAIAAFFKQQLAMAHNQLAWLVANTEGDFDAAIASSHESLKLRPGTSAYYDTLGRCYYAKRDLKNAIKYQKEALKLDPHSGQMQRQLVMFLAELKDK